MRWAVAASGVLCLGLLGGAASVSAGRQQAVFRTSVDLVRLDVLATVDGRPVAGLGAQDFEVIDNGVPQHVKVATTAGDVAVALVLDTSGSVKGKALDSLVAAGQTLVGMLRPGDSVSLVTFSSWLSLDADSVRDPSVLRRALVDARPSGRTALWDALFAGISLVAGRGQRSLVLLFTDGIDNSSWMTCEQVTEALGQADVVVYAVQPRPGSEAAGVFMRRTDLQSIANAAGGAVFEARSSDGLPQQFSAILKEFRSRYLLLYEPTGVGRDDGWHRVEVRVRGQRARIVTRPGYSAFGR